MNTFTFFKDLPVADKLTPEFMDAFDIAIPEWLNALLPFYQEAKRIDADVFELWPVLLLGDYFNDGKYEKDGLGYYYCDNGSAKLLSLESNPKYPSFNLNWQHYSFDLHPEVGYYSVERTCDYLYTHNYLTRYHNRKPPYDIVNNRVNILFQELTGDPNAGISLSFKSYITLSSRGVSYVNSAYLID